MVQYINCADKTEEPVRAADLELAGFTTPGWYFWDETDTQCYGPFDTEEKATEEREKYIRYIDTGELS